MKQPSLCTVIAALASVLFVGSEVLAQRDVPRFEIGGQFSLLSFDSPSSQNSLNNALDNPCVQLNLVGDVKACARVEPGFGVRFTSNLTNHIALDGEGNFFPGIPLEALDTFLPGRKTVIGVPGGHIYQGQFGVKAGKRFKKFGVFMKIRPGFVGFTEASQFTGFRLKTFLDPSHGTMVQLENAEFRIGKATYPSADVGGVVEFYPSRRIVTRLDVGDTIIRYGVYREELGIVCALCCPCPTQLFERPAETRHNLQCSAGIGIRF
jgi:hypothetical protein